ncbi:hypothetical protein AYK26_04075 [Euryarchaeota archaeon SM23-78]|nr:MAG: hypothetical protein AYK26_04075 [Euryarchaeota archaeon SM23-78]MBW3000960.1 hypothetical protein [Candidatus Woesearchaeota archaeon]
MHPSYETERQRAIQEIENLKTICKEINQAYRIRSQCIARRHELLQDIKEKNIKDVPETWYAFMHNTLLKEEKLLALIRSKEKGTKAPIAFAISILEAQKSRYKGDTKRYKRKYLPEQVSGKHLERFFADTIKILKITENDVRYLLTRMIAEDSFLENRDPKDYKRFLKFWRHELKLNQKVSKHYNKVIKRNKSIVYSKTSENLGPPRIETGLLLGASGSAIIEQKQGDSIPIVSILQALQKE